MQGGSIGGLRYSLTDVHQDCPFESFHDSCLFSYAEGPMSVDPPLEVTEVRFISSGRILKDCERVQGTVGYFFVCLCSTITMTRVVCSVQI